MAIGEAPLLKVTDLGLYCEQGDFYVDPWRAVDRAVVTHAHADHLYRGCGRYLLASPGLSVARARLDAEAAITTLDYGADVQVNGVNVSLHPAGHILGSSQVRIEYRGQVVVVSGDFKIEPDVTCATFEPVRCHLFISECTFGLPIYRWIASEKIFEEILGWWRANAQSKHASLLYAYSLGKAQRLLAGLASVVCRGADSWPGAIFTHGAVEVMNRAYRDHGVELPATTYVASAGTGVDWSSALIVAPPSVHGTPWIRRFGPASAAFASGWMRIRGARRRRAVDRGFVLSDHVDWPGLLSAIDATGAETVWLTHGYTSVVSRWLREHGKDAHPVATRFEGERDDGAGTPDPPLPAEGAAAETVETHLPTAHVALPHETEPHS